MDEQILYFQCVCWADSVSLLYLRVHKIYFLRTFVKSQRLGLFVSQSREEGFGSPPVETIETHKSREEPVLQHWVHYEFQIDENINSKLAKVIVSEINMKKDH